MSNGEQSVIPAPAKKEHHAVRAKRERAEMQALMDQFDVSSIDEIKALIEKSAALPDAPRAAAPVEPQAVEPTAYHDDLAWITEDVHAVYFVSNADILTLRPAKTKLMPPIDRVTLTTHRRGAWSSMPFVIDCKKDRTHESNQRMLLTSKWKHHVLTREVANEVFSDPRWPVPTKAVTDASKFTRFNGLINRAEGEYVELKNPDPLREMMRMLLQRKRGWLFIDSGRHVADGVDPRVPNPYGNNLAGYKAPEAMNIKREDVD